LAGLVTKGNPANRTTQDIHDTFAQTGRPWSGKHSYQQLEQVSHRLCRLSTNQGLYGAPSLNRPLRHTRCSQRRVGGDSWMFAGQECHIFYVYLRM